MGKRLHFEEFRVAIESRRMPPEKLADYVRFDPDSAIPKLIFRSNALLDHPPVGYNLDMLVCPWSHAIREERIAKQELFAFAGQKRIVAEGDSWFNLPAGWPYTIAEWIHRNGRFTVHNIACWGHTMKSMMQDREAKTYDEIETRKPDYFIFSGGGNDLLEALESGKFLHQYDPARPADAYLTECGNDVLNGIGEAYRLLIKEVLERFDVRFICFGYDYPRPIVGGEFIGKYMKDPHNIPLDLMKPIMVAVLIRLNELIEQAASAHPKKRVRYLYCLGDTSSYTEHDEVHPSSDGFLALATKFEEALTIWDSKPS